MTETAATRATELRARLADAIRQAACDGNCGQSEEECARERIQPFVWHHGKLAAVDGSPELFADAVLPIVAAECESLIRGQERLRERLRLLTDEKVADVTGPTTDLLCAEIARLKAEAARGQKAEALLMHFAAEAHRRKWNYDPGLSPDGTPRRDPTFDVLHGLGDQINDALHKLRAQDGQA